MKLQTIHFDEEHGWSEAFPDMDSERTLVIVFGASQNEETEKAVGEVVKAYPHSKVLGCSSSGEIFGPDVEDNSLSVAIAKFDKANLKVTGTSIDDPEQSMVVGEQLSKELNADDLKSILVLSDGLVVNGTDLVEGLKKQVGKDVIITGGLAGDADRFEKTWVLDKTLHSHGVVAVGFYGDSLRIGCGSQGGWDIFGPERKITKSEGNVVYEIDGQPALELYKNYLGERADGLPSTGLLFPLAIRASLDDKPVVRTILAVDEDTQSLTFAGTVPEGWYTQLMRANFDRLIDGASDAGKMAMDKAQDSGSDTLALAISCVGRRLVLGERTEEEVEAVLETLPEKTKLIGFYSYGEISPMGVQDCSLHNQTMTLTTITEG